MRGGFTLLELVVVLALVGILAAVSVPALVSWTDSADPHETALRELVAVLESARARATDRAVPVRVVVDSGEGRYWTSALHPEGPAELERGLLIDAGHGALELEVAGPDAQAGRARFVFRPGGAAAGDTLILRDAGRSARISVDPWTGAARVERR